MKRIFHYFASPAAVAALALVSGCSTVSVQSTAYLGTPTYPPTDPVTIQILQRAPTQPNVRLGEITAEPSGSPTKAEIQQKLQQAAAKMGANAVVIVSDRTEIMGGVVTGGWYDRQISPEMGRVITAVAIRYNQQPAAQAAP